MTPKDFFLWVGAMVCLYASTFAFIELLFNYIDYVFPNALSYQPDPYAGGMPYEMAMLIVLVPAFLVLMRVIRNIIAADETRGEVWIRRWVLVLTLFAAGATIVIDLIILLHKFLSGQELTTGFLLKVVVVLLVASLGFMHFLADFRGYWKMFPKRARMVGYGTGALVLIVLIAGFFIVGTPMQARLIRMDTQRISDLQTIQWQIVSFWQQKQKLPATLDELKDPISGFITPRDPLTGAAYEYRATGPLSFQLCATFAEVGAEPSYGKVPRPVVSGPTDAISSEVDSWQHKAGVQCFERPIDPERYPPFKK